MGPDHVDLLFFLNENFKLKSLMSENSFFFSHPSPHGKIKRGVWRALRSALSVIFVNLAKLTLILGFLTKYGFKIIFLLIPPSKRSFSLTRHAKPPNKAMRGDGDWRLCAQSINGNQL